MEVVENETSKTSKILNNPTPNPNNNSKTILITISQMVKSTNSVRTTLISSHHLTTNQMQTKKKSGVMKDGRKLNLKSKKCNKRQSFKPLTNKQKTQSKKTKTIKRRTIRRVIKNLISRNNSKITDKMIIELIKRPPHYNQSTFNQLVQMLSLLYNHLTMTWAQHNKSVLTLELTIPSSNQSTNKEIAAINRPSSSTMGNSHRCRVMTEAFYMRENQQADHNLISSSTRS
jgi:hypothetical protein